MAVTTDAWRPVDYGVGLPSDLATAEWYVSWVRTWGRIVYQYAVHFHLGREAAP